MLVCGSLNWVVTEMMTIIPPSGQTIGKSNAAKSCLFQSLMVLYTSVHCFVNTRNSKLCLLLSTSLCRTNLNCKAVLKSSYRGGSRLFMEWSAFKTFRTWPLALFLRIIFSFIFNENSSTNSSIQKQLNSLILNW